MDFGRITLDDDLVLCLFCLFGCRLPGGVDRPHHRFLWDDETLGELGAVVLAAPVAFGSPFPALDHYESSGLPYVLAVDPADYDNLASVAA